MDRQQPLPDRLDLQLFEIGGHPGGLFGGGVEYALTDHLLVGTSINWVEYQTRTSPALYYYSQAIPYRYKMPADSFYLRLSVNYKLW
jgi:opacity protein-like surface antigen